MLLTSRASAPVTLGQLLQILRCIRRAPTLKLRRKRQLKRRWLLFHPVPKLRDATKPAPTEVSGKGNGVDVIFCGPALPVPACRDAADSDISMGIFISQDSRKHHAVCLFYDPAVIVYVFFGWALPM